MTLINKFALIALVILPASVSAQSRTALAIAAGPSIPTGRLRNTQQTGTDLNIGLIRGSDDSPVGLRFDFGYDKLKGKTVNGVTQPERRTVSGTANVVLSFAGYSMKPYVLAGVGGFRMTSHPSVAQEKTKFGFDFGLGVTIPIATKAFFIEGRLNSISQQNAKPIRYAPIVVGILF